MHPHPILHLDVLISRPSGLPGNQASKTIAVTTGSKSRTRIRFELCLGGFAELEETVLFLSQGTAEQTSRENLRHNGSPLGASEWLRGRLEAKPDHVTS